MLDPSPSDKSQATRADRRAFAQEQRRQGKSVREIAALLGVSKSTAARWCQDVNEPDTPTSHAGAPGKARTTRRDKKNEGSWWGVAVGLGLTAAACIVPFFFRRPPGD